MRALEIYNWIRGASQKGASPLVVGMAEWPKSLYNTMVQDSGVSEFPTYHCELVYTLAHCFPFLEFNFVWVISYAVIASTRQSIIVM